MRSIQLYDPFREQYMDLSLSDGKTYTIIEIINDCNTETFELNAENLDKVIEYLKGVRKEMV